ncbi:MAG: methyltransferase domain-containing protein [Bacteroidetes bacterium]|nr:methyltransferase domain-containing protein [Bacteroidota bacterium]
MFYPKIKVPVLQNRAFNTREEAIGSDFGYLQIEQDPQTGIFENRLFDGDKLIYDQNYDNEQANSPAFEAHLDQVAEILKPFMAGKKVIEVGCGKGHFFRKLSDRGADIVGCDPTYQGDDPRIIREFFSPELGQTGDVIILRHVLEHIQHPADFIRYIAQANGNKGVIYIEVPDLSWIIANQVYFDLFYEHVNYFRPEDFRRIFGRIYAQGVFFNGQYQYVVADLSAVNPPPYDFEKVDDRLQVSFQKLDQISDRLKKTARPVYIWGAASKGVISSLHLLDRGVKIEGLIDINPRKQGKYAAMTGLPILSPAAFKARTGQAVVLIANPNYESEIRAELKGMDVDFENL